MNRKQVFDLLELRPLRKIATHPMGRLNKDDLANPRSISGLKVKVGITHNRCLLRRNPEPPQGAKEGLGLGLQGSVLPGPNEIEGEGMSPQHLLRAFAGVVGHKNATNSPGAEESQKLWGPNSKPPQPYPLCLPLPEALLRSLSLPLRKPRNMPIDREAIRGKA